MTDYINGFTRRIDGIYYTENGEYFIPPKNMYRNRHRRSWVVRLRTQFKRYVVYEFTDSRYQNDYRESYRAAVDKLASLTSTKTPASHARISDISKVERIDTYLKDDRLKQRYFERLDEAKALSVNLTLDKKSRRVIAGFNSWYLTKYPRKDRQFVIGSLEEVCDEAFSLEGAILHQALILFKTYRKELLVNGFSPRIGCFYITSHWAVVKVPAGLYRDRVNNLWHINTKNKRRIYFPDRNNGWETSLQQALDYLCRSAAA